DLDLSLELWDGTRVPLGSRVSDDLRISIAGPGVIGALVRRPTLNRFIDLYSNGLIEIAGGTVIDLGERLTGKGTRKGLKSISKRRLAGALLPFLFVAAERPGHGRAYGGDATGDKRQEGENKQFIQFHYDVGNDFYELFLDSEMQYTCAYFTDWNNSLEQAQRDKMDIVCRKLRLKPGERMLDVGCGWGGLACHAARHYGVSVYGFTLSQAQVDYANEKIARLGLKDKVVIELKDYADVTGTYDKIAAIGIGEHLGVANYPRYFAKMRSLLADGGLFLNHANTRPSRRHKRKFGHRPEQRALQKHIFPGGELDDIGNTIQVMEQQGWEVRDVESFRDYYALTTRMWCERLTGNKDKAIALAGPQTYHMWVAYLDASSIGFVRNNIRIYQTLAAKKALGPAPLPPTRADLYR
ncbi:MAG TPA: cyclopropane-fatty-acyl-phospholipid synthase family protein, partial [Hyphomicrobiales bacterium]|nr:cyclopropane-fatty-acyl-phospholipid synthase family protein [Hyphomicrobiales bacterium]